MASRSKKTSPAVLILITIVGLVLGSLFSLIIDTILGQFAGEGNVIGIFTASFPIGIGFPEPVLIDLNAIKFHLGFELKINLMSFLGLWLSHRFYKSYQ